MNAKYLLIPAFLFFISTTAFGLVSEKVKLQNNCIVKYLKIPGKVSTFHEMFDKSITYGRLRTNFMGHHWKNENTGKSKNNSAFGFGGSLVLKTGFLNGWGATAGMYTTNAPFSDNSDNRFPGKDFGKACKDTYDRGKGSGAAINSLAESYIEFKQNKFDIKAGRQKFESKLIHSNDTKMIPNTFQGFSVTNNSVKKTKLTAAWLYQQKLRDHRDFHSLIAVDGYEQNDDSAIHKGLSINNIDKQGSNSTPGMFLFNVGNNSIENLKLSCDYMHLQNYFTTIVGDVGYKMKLNNGWSLSPSIRYLLQYDSGAGKIGGAALTGKLAGLKNWQKGYSDADSVDGGLWAGKLVLAKGPGNIKFAYSKVFDDADIIAPWRGFPTAGYTRAMSQYNWEANTKTWLIKLYYDFGKAKKIPGFRTALEYAKMNYDDNKIKLGSITKTDRSTVHFDVWKTFPGYKNLELKARVGIVNADKSIGTINNTNSYKEYRFETNYLF